MDTLHPAPKKILVVKPSAMGDIIHSLPLLDTLHRHFRGAKIHWVVAKGLQELLQGHPMVQKLWIIEKDRWKQAGQIGQTVRTLMRLAAELKQERYDLVVDLQGLLRSGGIAWATRARRRVGFAEAREGGALLYTHRVRGGREIHAIDRYLRIAAALGCDTSTVRFPFPPLPAIPHILQSLPPRFAILAPSAGKAANRWPAERFGALASRLPIPAVVVSSKADAPLAEHVAAASDGNAVSLAGQTGLLELAALIQGASLCISNDTGPMHIAAAFQVPVVALFGPANPVRTGPYGNIHTIIREPLPCAPCYRKRRCADWRCMEAITVERVLEAVRAKLEPTESRGLHAKS